jgi:DNA-binding CsgD family transcriptional regulator
MTPKERRSLELITKGHTNRQIAATQDPGRQDHEELRSNLLAKLGVEGCT